MEEGSNIWLQVITLQVVFLCRRFSNCNFMTVIGCMHNIVAGNVSGTYKLDGTYSLIHTHFSIWMLSQICRMLEHLLCVRQTQLVNQYIYHTSFVNTAARIAKYGLWWAKCTCPSQTANTQLSHANGLNYFLGISSDQPSYANDSYKTSQFFIVTFYIYYMNLF